MATFPVLFMQTFFGAGYWMGGGRGIDSSSVSSKVDGLLFGTQTSRDTSATVGAATYRTGVNSTSTGYCMGGWWLDDNMVNVGDYSITSISGMSFISESNKSVSAVLSQTRSAGCGASSISKGYVSGGKYWASGFGLVDLTDIESLVFSSETRSDVTASLAYTQSRAGGVNSDAKGYFGGGYSSWTYGRWAASIAFSNESVSAHGTALAVAIGTVAGVESSTTGYFCSGTEVESVQFSNDTFGNPSVVLSSSRAGVGNGVDSTICGYFGNGSNSGGSAITKLKYDNESSETLSATMAQARSNAAGVQWGAL